MQFPCHGRRSRLCELLWIAGRLSLWICRSGVDQPTGPGRIVEAHIGPSLDRRGGKNPVGSILEEKQNGDGGCILLTLLVHGATLVWGVRVVGGIAHLSVALVDHAAARGAVLARNLAISGLVADGRELRANTAGVGGGLALRGVGGARGVDLVGLHGLGSSTLTLLSGLALSLFLLLSGLPFLADLLEF